jgi:hypothetical protein
MASRAPDTSTIDLDRELTRLYRAPLDEFVTLRNELATALKKAGRADDAAAARALEKPSVTAWAINQVWWNDRRTFENMLSAGERLRDEQRASLRGKAANLREAVEERQRAIGDVIDLAVRAMGGNDRVSPPMRQRLSATADALATGDVPQGTVLGRLTHDLQPAGFAALSAFMPLVAEPSAPAAPLKPTKIPASVMPFTPKDRSPTATGTPATRLRDRERAREDAAARARADAREQAQAALAVAETRLQELDAAARTQREALAMREREHAAVEARVGQLTRELAEAQRQLDQAASAVKDATRQLAAAEAARERATEPVAKAKRRLQELR